MALTKDGLAYSTSQPSGEGLGYMYQKPYADSKNAKNSSFDKPINIMVGQHRELI